MPTNPGNIVRIRSRNGGRASVYESNMWAQKFTGGLFSGNGVRQNTSADMNILVGGSSTNPDVVIGQNAAGYNIALDLVGTQTVAITKPASNSRISAIVAYTNDLSLTSADAGTTGSPSSCGLLVVHGASSASPVAPSNNDIRTAITADGATGSQATYCVIATILVASTTTTITNTLISTRKAQLPTAGIADGAVTSDKVDFTTMLKPKQVAANDATSAQPGTFVSTTYGFVQGFTYLLMFNVQQRSYNNTGSVWQWEIRVDGNAVSTSRSEGTGQGPQPIIGLYTAVATSTLNVTITASRLTGGAAVNIEAPRLMIIPILAK